MLGLTFRHLAVGVEFTNLMVLVPVVLNWWALELDY